ncbi:MAG TPA: glycosyltransferase [Solirubrobacterales bacterium]
MKIAAFFHSRSRAGEWSEAHARFLHSVLAELRRVGHDVASFPPGMRTTDLDACLGDADLALVHAGCGPALVGQIGDHHARNREYRLLFYDTHGLTESLPGEKARFDLSGYDGVLARGEAIRHAYLEHGWAERAWTWQYAADVRAFHPQPVSRIEGDLVWVAEWGDEKGTRELRELLLRPARRARLHGSVFGPTPSMRDRLRIRLAGLHHRGPARADRVPELYAAHRMTVDLPHPLGGEALPGMPTMRIFEALACGIPLISAPWDDCDGLFRAEHDYLVARDEIEMREAMRAIVEFPAFAAELARNGLETIRARHTCAHRVEELLAVDAELRGASGQPVADSMSGI